MRTDHARRSLWGTACPGVRPGALVYTAAPQSPAVIGDGHCTLNFLFAGSDGAKYIGTAGHCILVPPQTEVVWSRGRGPAAFDADGRRIGRFVYGIVTIRPGVTADYLPPELSPPTRFRDFALIRLDRNVKASAQLCHFGGPTRLNNGTVPVTEPVVLHMYGNGTPAFVSTTRTPLLPARTAVANGMPDRDRLSFDQFNGPGDSGAPVISDDGAAVGLVFGPDDNALDDGHLGTSAATRIAPQIARASGRLGIGLRLQTARLL